MSLLPLQDGFAQNGAKIDDDDPAINARGDIVNRVISVLRLQPDAAGEKCISLLSDMHKAQEQLEELEKSEDNPDIGLGRDVLASDMEEVVLECGADASRFCKKGMGDKDPKTRAQFSALCEALPQQNEEEEAAE